MSDKISVTVNGSVISSDAGQTLSETVSGERPCGGHGKCGKCKIIVRGSISSPSDTELKLLSEEELARGVRLACLTRALGDCEVLTLSVCETSQIVTVGALPSFELKPIFSNYGIAIDIGTTTVAARLYDVNGNMISEGSVLNPQAEFGADVISRIEASLAGKGKALAESVRIALNGMITKLTESVNADNVDCVVITGNTVMLSLLVGESVEPLSHAPFHSNRLFDEKLTAGELSLRCLQPQTRVYLPPCISAFVGADITCAILATKLCDNASAILADIGTNGELALWHGGELTVCSTAAGPAFEGVGISMGMRGSVGAIDRVEAIGGEIKAHVIGDVEPTGICGSGLIDAAAVMLENEIIDESGYLEDDPFTVMPPVSVSARDIRMLQLAKSAICAGLLTLTESAKLSIGDIQALYIAGGFGNYLNKISAAKIGLLPVKLADIAVTVGNAALAGASLILLNADSADDAKAVSATAKVIDLSANPTFSEHYMTGMLFGEI